MRVRGSAMSSSPQMRKEIKPVKSIHEKAATGEVVNRMHASCSRSGTDNRHSVHSPLDQDANR